MWVCSRAVSDPSPQRICLNCKELFLPNRRNRWHQRFCTQPACRLASKARSQAQWRKENPDYFRGEHHVNRVRAWREAHPGYGKRPPAEPPPPLQEVLPLQPVAPEPVPNQPSAQPPQPLQEIVPPLQDFVLSKPLVTGMIAHIFDCPLQEDVERTLRRLVVMGMDILGTTPGAKTKCTTTHDTKTTPLPRAPTPGSSTLQLAGSPPGAR